VRIGVACAESGAYPAAQSLIADLFARRWRATMLSVYAASAPVGGALGLALGALVASVYGWRAAFVIIGLPGLVLALLVWLTAFEPRRFRAQGHTRPPSVVPLRNFLPTLYKDPQVRLALLIAVSVAFTGGGVGGWSAPFFMRIHHMSLRAVGSWLGAATLVGGVCGGLLSGFVSDRLAARDLRWYPRVAALGVLLGLPASILYLTIPESGTAIAWMLVERFTSSFWLGPIFALILTVVEPGVRALLAATLTTLITVSGGLGGLCVGLLSDRLYPFAGDLALRGAMLAAVAPAAVAGVCCLLLIRIVPRSLPLVPPPSRAGSG
jgi:MFS family permease